MDERNYDPRRTGLTCALIGLVMGCTSADAASGPPPAEAVLSSNAGSSAPAKSEADSPPAAEVAQLAETPGPRAADGYSLSKNCPELGGLDQLPLGGDSLRPSQMAFSNDGRRLYIAYQSAGGAGAHPGQVHVRDVWKCKQRELIKSIRTPVGVAVHPRNGLVYVTHLDGTRSAVSVFDPKNGAVVVDRLVRDLPASNFGLGITGNGAQGLTFDRAGNLYIAMNVNVEEEGTKDYRASAVLKVDGKGAVSVFASGLRATYEAVIAKSSSHGVAKAFYATDNGEGDRCFPRDPRCSLNGDPRASRQYYDELDYVIEGGHYGYPESAPGFPAAEATHRDHIGPLWNFEKLLSGPFQNLWPIPAGLALLEGEWGDVDDPLFVAFWRAGVDMFTGPNRTERTQLVTNMDQAIDVAVAPKRDTVFVAEYNTGFIYTVEPECH